MRFMVMVKADAKTEAGVLPTAADFEAMGKFNEQLIKAGVMKDAAGLQPSSKGARISFGGGTPIVTDGPFAETKELIAGYWVWDVKSKQEAIEWAKKIPFRQLPNEGVPGVEIRQFYELEDFKDVPKQVADMERNFTG